MDSHDFMVRGLDLRCRPLPLSGALMHLRDWLAIILVLVVGLIGVHQYDDEAAESTARSAATIVYRTQLSACQDANPTRGIQRRYFATIALGRATSAQNEDAGNPIQHAVDRSIAVVSHDVAETYIHRFGARPSGKLDCHETTTRP